MSRNIPQRFRNIPKCLGDGEKWPGKLARGGFGVVEAALEREQESFDLLEARLGFLFRQAREFAAERDEIVVARDL